MGAFSWLFPQSPYRFKGNSTLPYAGFGVSERAFLGTSPGAPHMELFPQWGKGGIPVRRQLFPAAPAPLLAGGTGAAAIVGPSGLTGGLYQTGAATVTALQQYVQQQAYNGNGAPPPLGS